jgi:hypothetical protein
MDLIREHLIYKDIPIHICFSKLKPTEQYECIRLLFATRTKDVFICKHNSVNSYIEKLLEDLKFQEEKCLELIT